MFVYHNIKWESFTVVVAVAVVVVAAAAANGDDDDDDDAKVVASRTQIWLALTPQDAPTIHGALLQVVLHRARKPLLES